MLVSPQIRAGLKQMTTPHLPRLVVLSFNEITRDTQIESVALVADATGDKGKGQGEVGHAVRASAKDEGGRSKIRRGEMTDD